MKKRLALYIAALVLAAGCGTRATFTSQAGTDLSQGGTAGGAPGGPAAAATNPATAAATPGAPVSTAPIRVGFVLQDASGASAIVASSVPITSTQRQQQIAQWLVDYVNAHGGVGRRKIVPSFEKVAVTDTEPTRVGECEVMAQDQHDQAVMDMSSMLTDAEWGCFAHNHVDFVGNVSGTDRPFMDADAPYITTTFMGLDRQMYALAHGASQVGWLAGQETHVGILMPDSPEGHEAFTKVLAPQLAAVGVTHYDVRFVTLTDGAAQTSQTNNAELAFNTEHITRILFVHDILVYEQFTNQAAAQVYHPEYAYPDFEGAAGVAAYYGSTATNAGSIAVSSDPSYIEDNNSQNVKSAGTVPIDRSTASAPIQQCLDLLTKASGVNFYDPAQSQDPDLDSIYYCDELFLWWKAAANLGAAFTPATFGRGLEAIGTNYGSTEANSVDFSSGHNDGGSSFRVGRYDATCSCFVKATGWIGAPT
jgi:hypothetical protein